MSKSKRRVGGKKPTPRNTRIPLRGAPKDSLGKSNQQEEE